MPGDPIQFFNRYSGQVETEAIYGEKPLRLAYENSLGRSVLELLVKRRIFSQWYGWRMNQPASRSKIEPFIQQYGLDVREFADSPETFRTFNEFFYRQLKPLARPIAPSDEAVVFPADGRHLGFPNLDNVEGIFVKGQRFDLARLLGDPEMAAHFAGGTLVLSRLCPVDYHRYHFCCGGMPGPARMLNGPLYSVSPVALRRQISYLWENKRMITLLNSQRLGTVAILEIGATNVGSIHQTFIPGQPVQKGAEKGYFSFGGSSTITIFERGRVSLAEDLIRESSHQRELYARMGDAMATVIP